MTSYLSMNPESIFEMYSMLKLKYSLPIDSNENLSLSQLAKRLPDEEFCFAALTKVSRSFAIVIQQLPEELKKPVCVFYLVLRGLDTVEDDMNLVLDEKLTLLQNFHLLIRDPDWSLFGVGDSQEYQELIENFDKVNRTFLSLHSSYQTVITTICKQMSEGMRMFASRGVKSKNDYDLYCHYVAGLVGYGLSDLFAASGIEKRDLSLCTSLSNAMGLFLQKTNITRDIYEDVCSNRLFWPEEIYLKYVSKPSALIMHPVSGEAQLALHEMVFNALQHYSDCILYLKKLQNIKVFRFCAIPQLMALATLTEVYANDEVFYKAVKIRKGLTARILTSTQDMDDVRSFSLDFLKQLKLKIDRQQPDYLQCLQLIHNIEQQLDNIHKPTLF